MRHLSVALLASAFAGWASPAAAQDCAALAGRQSGSVVVTAATPIAASPGWAPTTDSFYKPLPITAPICRVQGMIEGDIGFELWLPTGTSWNGRLLGAGVGGDAGVFNYTDMSRRIGEGFATLTTDGGHKAAQAHWMLQAKARTDYEHRAVHLTALAAKRVIARYYAKPADKSYFLGCSGGGRQALKEMQVYPSDYDGVVAGAPGPNMPLISVRMMWLSLLQKHDPVGALTDADWALYEKATVADCDGLDGVRDGVIENPRRCGFKTATLLCKPGQAAACLTAPKLTMLQRIVSSMPDEQGRAMDKGLLAGVRTRPGPPSPLLRAMWGDAVYGDVNWNEDSFRRTHDLMLVNRAMPQLRADSVAIAPFVRRGGKAIIYQGWQDPSVIAGPTVDYYRRLAAANGGETKLSEAVRLFMVPGMYHCRGGPGADQFGGSGHIAAPSDPSHDILWSLIDWVEHRRAPDRIVATRIVADRPRFTRALCAFPASAVYDGKGNPDDAASYACRRDPALASR